MEFNMNYSDEEHFTWISNQKEIDMIRKTLDAFNVENLHKCLSLIPTNSFLTGQVEINSR